ncbi:MAG: DUF2796 domain-containing protein [Burkholderiaceae bacterium]|nr:DUF2796 domain-containing protein [Burkholderiaceae bacterium]
MVALAIACSGGASAVWAAGKAHEHGALRLDVAIEGNKLTIAMEAPLDNLLGFERAPRTDAERKAAADLLARLRSPGTGVPLFAPDAAAQCTLSRSDVQAPVLEPGAGPAAKDEHADLDASYEFSCAKPDELRTLDVGLFEAYKRTQRIDVQVAGPKGQARVTLKRPARTVRLAR